MEAFKTSPGYIDKQKWFYFIGEGLNTEHVTLSRSLPKNSNTISVDPSKAAEINKLSNTISDLRSKRKELKTSIAVALFNLRTYNNVREKFPEAYALLPAGNVSTAVSINIEDIRCKLNKENCK